MNALLLGSLVAILITLSAYYTRRNRYRLPPGPKGLPIIGNAWDLPGDGREWLTYQRWGHTYNSDVLHLRLSGRSIVILNSAKAAVELLEKRSAIYSDRPHQVMFHDLVGWSRSFAFARYDDDWREHRRLFHQHFYGDAVHAYRPRMARESRKLLCRLLVNSGDFMKDLRAMAAAVILGVAFGLEAESEYNSYVLLAEEAMHSLGTTVKLGSYIVDSVPILRYLPSWVPGGRFKRDAAKWNKAGASMYAKPLEMVEEALAEGTARPSVAATLLVKLDDGGDNSRHERAIQDITGTAFGAGFESTISALGTFVLAMVLYPDIQKAAQDQIDRIVGSERLPEFHDRDSLPYLTAILHELFRWRPLFPLVMPHRVMVDDEYKGYHIPAGATIVGNAWAICHDATRYPNPDKFDPTRYLASDEQFSIDTADATPVFGFGRRSCVGRHFAMDTMWIAMAHILAVFTIEKPIDESGNIIEPSGEYIPGFLISPEPFKAIFKPRSAAALALLQSLELFD